MARAANRGDTRSDVSEVVALANLNDLRYKSRPMQRSGPPVATAVPDAV
jgi:hypothetical protein